MSKYYQDFVGLNTFIYEVTNDGYYSNQLYDSMLFPIPGLAHSLDKINFDGVPTMQSAVAPFFRGPHLSHSVYKLRIASIREAQLKIRSLGILPNYLFNSNFSTLWPDSDGVIFNALMSYRNGPYGYPTWKQIRVSQNPLIRSAKKHNIFSFTKDTGEIFKSVINGKTVARINRNGDLKLFFEPPVTDTYKPLTLIASVEPPAGSYSARKGVSGIASISTTFSNDTAFFANNEINEYYNTFEDTDESYESLKDLYLDGALDEDSSPIDEFKMLIYRQTIFPRPKFAFLSHTRSRLYFKSEFWKDKRSERTVVDVTKFGTNIRSGSIWALDAPEDFAKRSLPTLAVNPSLTDFHVFKSATGGIRATSTTTGDLGAPGILLQRYSNFLSIPSFDIDNKYPADNFERVVDHNFRNLFDADYDNFGTASCQYAYEHCLVSIRSCENKASMNNEDCGYAKIPIQHTPIKNDINGNLLLGSHMGRSTYKFLHETIMQLGNANWDVPSQSGKAPFYNSYEDYAEKARLKGKGYSIVPEFVMSKHVETYEKISITDELPAIFELSGALGTFTTTAGENPNFYNVYTTSEFLKHFKIIVDDHKDFTSPAAITLRCKAIKKFLPYEGFYPAERTVQMAEMFYHSCQPYVKTSHDIESAKLKDRLEQGPSGNGPNVFPDDNFNPKIGAQLVLEPLFAPGVLFNTIKAGVACDFPILTYGQRPQPFYVDYASRNDEFIGNKETWYVSSDYGRMKGSINPREEITETENTLWAYRNLDRPMLVLDGGDGGYRGVVGRSFTRKNGFNLGGMYDRRVPFEALLEPERYLAGVDLISQQPSPASISNLGGLNIHANWSGVGDEIYKKFANNFLAEVPEFFLEGQNFSTIASAESGDPSFGNAKSGSFYGMRIKMYRTMSGPKTGLLGFDGELVTPPQVLRGVSIEQRDFLNTTNGSNIQMYSRPSAFGPPTWGCGGTGFFFYRKAVSADAEPVVKLTPPPVEYSENTSDSTEGYNMPYTPPYYDGEGWCDLLFEATETKKYTLDEILKQVKDFPYYTRFWWNGINDALRDLTGYNVPETASVARCLMREHYWEAYGPNRKLKGPYENYKSEFGCPWSNLIFDSRAARFSRDTVGPYPTWVLDLSSLGRDEKTQALISALPQGVNDGDFDPGFEHDLDLGRRFPFKVEPEQQVDKDINQGGILPATFTDWGDQRYTDGWHQFSGAWAGPPTMMRPGLIPDRLQSVDTPGPALSRQMHNQFNHYKRMGTSYMVKMLGTDIYQKNTVFTHPDFLVLLPQYVYGPQHPFYINSNAMQLNSSLNLFTKGKIRKQNLAGDFSSVKQDVATSTTNDSKSRWIIQSKFETPILNFIKYREKERDGKAVITTPRNGFGHTPRGMWHQYGEIPSGSNEGIFMQVTDIPYSWLKGALGVTRTKRKVKSLADLVGFSKKPVRLGEIAKAKEIGELVVAVPFVERDNERVFFSLARADIERAISGLNKEVRPGIYIDEKGNRVRPPLVGNSVLNQVRMMKKYNFPPSMDFVKYKQVDPFAAYCFEFTHKLDKQDLADIWQNLPPKIGRNFQEATATVSHQLLAKDLLGKGAEVSKSIKGDSSSIFDINEPGPGIDPEIQWMVFKCKKKAATNYYDKVLVKKGTTRKTKEFKLENVKNTAVGSNDEITFNWPYDFFSLVELVKIDAQVTFADLQPESEQPIPKPKRKSLERRKLRRKKRIMRGKKRGGRKRRLRDRVRKWWQKRDTREERRELRRQRREKRQENRQERKNKRKNRRKDRKKKRKSRRNK